MIGPNSSGRIAATSSTAQPAWQLPMTQGLPSALGMQRDHLLEEHAPRRCMMSSIVWPGIGSGVKPMK